MPEERLRAWRHDEMADGFPGDQPRWKRALSAALAADAIVLIFPNVRDAVGW